MAVSVSSFTGDRYTVLKVIPNYYITGDFMYHLQRLLQAAGYTYTGMFSGTYDYTVEELVKQFQIDSNLTVNGNVDDKTLQSLYDTIDGLFGEKVYDDEEEETTPSGDLTIGDGGIEKTLSHFQPFFDESNKKSFRKNKCNLEISFGNGSIKKTIEQVFIRSVGVEVDTSGDPIFETYQFIAKDIKESDEPTDAEKDRTL